LFKLNRLTQSLVMVGLVLPVMAYAQDVPAAPKKDEAKPQRIEVTGSSIKRVRDEGAVPCRSSRRRTWSSRASPVPSSLWRPCRPTAMASTT
jgi:hypothetical protein